MEASASVNPYGTTPPPVAGLRGVHMNGMDCAGYLYDAGFKDSKLLTVALATFYSESAWFQWAFHHNLDSAGSVDSTDWGWIQINDKSHPKYFPNGDPNPIAFDPVKAAQAAFEIYTSNGNSFAPWFGYSNGVYLDDYYIRRANLAMLNFNGRLMVQAAQQRAPVIAGRSTPPTTTRVPMISVKEFNTIYPPTLEAEILESNFPETGWKNK